MWFGLEHPHLLRLLGASHVGERFFAVESTGDVPYVTLREFVCCLETLANKRELVWQRLTEAAKALAFLDERGLSYGGATPLTCSDILVSCEAGAGTATSAKLDGRKLLRLPTSGDDNCESQLEIEGNGWHWAAPEVLPSDGPRPHAASVVYSLGMCIVESMTRADPWSDCDEDAAKQVIACGALFEPPTELEGDDGEGDDVWKLIVRMCALDPDDRPSVSTVASPMANVEVITEHPELREHSNVDAGGQSQAESVGGVDDEDWEYEGKGESWDDHQDNPFSC